MAQSLHFWIDSSALEDTSMFRLASIRYLRSPVQFVHVRVALRELASKPTQGCIAVRKGVCAFTITKKEIGGRNRSKN
jgi:hypothetical protein